VAEPVEEAELGVLRRFGRRTWMLPPVGVVAPALVVAICGSTLNMLATCGMVASSWLVVVTPVAATSALLTLMTLEPVGGAPRISVPVTTTSSSCSSFEPCLSAAWLPKAATDRPSDVSTVPSRSSDDGIENGLLPLLMICIPLVDLIPRPVDHSLSTKWLVSKDNVARSRSRRSREDPAARRQQILDGAIRTFGQRGYHGFTVRELAKSCGLSNAGLLHYFPSKDQLLEAVMQEMERRELQALAPLAARTYVSLPAFLAFMQALVARESTYPEFARLYAVLQSESLDEVHPAHDSFRARESAQLKRFARLVAPHVAEPRSTARHLVALMDGLRLQWLRDGQKFDMAAEWARAVTTLVPGLNIAGGRLGSGPNATVEAVRKRRRSSRQEAKDPGK
jgi:AcrR family transcriptional regulator